MLLISCLASVFLYLFYTGKIQAYDRNIQLLSEQLEHCFVNQTNTLAGHYSVRLQSFINTNQNIIKAFKLRDRERLYNLTLPRFNALKKENEFLLGFTYILPDATILLHMQKPDFFGDSVSHIPFAQHVLKKKKTSIGFAITKIGAFYRIVSPVYVDDTFIGAIGWAFKVSLLAEHISKFQNVAFGIFADSERYKKLVMQDKELVEISEHALIKTSENVDIFRKLPTDFNLHAPNQIVTIDNRNFVIHSDQMKNFAGQHVGDILLASDITAETTLFRTQIIDSIVVTLMTLALSFIILYLSFNRLLGKIEKLNETLEIRVEERTKELQESLDKVKVLSGLLPICASCKKIRDDKGYWNQIESYIRDHSEAEFSHSICPKCAKELYPDFIKKND